MIRQLALVLTVLTGFSGLVYQVAWQKYLAILLGSHAEATATVLGIFLGGLSAGYALFGALSRRLQAHPSGDPGILLRAYGIVEMGIGAYALFFPTLFMWVQSGALAIPAGSDLSTFLIDVSLTALLIGPPTVLMGGTIPLLTQGLAHDLDDATRFHSFVYAFNTVGAFAGALAAGFVIVPLLGLEKSVVAMGFINLAAGALFLVLARWTTDKASKPSVPAGSAAVPARFVVYASVACLAGFAMMTMQTVLNRIGALSLGASQFTFAMVVAVFVLSIAIGSLVVSAFRRISPSYLIIVQWSLALILLCIYPLVEYAPYWTYLVRKEFGPQDFYAFHLRIFVWILAVTIIPVGLSGATLPLLFHHLRNQVGDLGSVAGRLYAWNTVGSLLGALLGGYLLLFWLDLHHVYRLAVAALAVGAALLTVQVYRSAKVWGGGALVLVLVAVVLMPAWQPSRLSVGLFRQSGRFRPYDYLSAAAFIETEWRQKEIAYYEDDPSMSVAVVVDGEVDPPSIAIYNNGKSDSEIPYDRLTTGLLGLLPAILVDEPENAFVIGFGTGYTVGSLAALDSIEDVLVAEISSGVIRAADYFEDLNLNAMASPKTRMIRSDAYRALLRGSQRYDLIVSEPPNPWVAGVEMLFSREFLLAARGRLTRDGIYAQWFHLYEMDQPTTNLVLRTYLEVFDRVAVWTAKHSDLIIIGFNDDRAEVDLAAIERRYHQRDYRRELEAIGIASFPAFLAHEATPLGALRRDGLRNEVHTIMHPILGYRAARAFYRGGEAAIPPTIGHLAARDGAANSLAGKYLAGLDATDRSRAMQRMSEQLCENVEARCLGMLARWRFEDPESLDQATLLKRLRLREDSAVFLSENNIGYARQLFRPDGILEIPSTYESARSVLGIFTSAYNHAVPFDSRALVKAWERCSTDPRCAKELDTIRNLGLSAELDSEGE